MSLFDRSAALQRSLLFYPQGCGRSLLAPYSDGVDMDRQVAKRAAFLTMSTGRPGRYTGRDLCTAHAGLAGLTDEHVGRVIGHLAQTLRELGAARGRHRRRRAVAGSARDDVLNR